MNPANANRRPPGTASSSAAWLNTTPLSPKGAHLLVTGELSIRQYTAKNSATKSNTEIQVQRINRLDRSVKQEVTA